MTWLDGWDYRKSHVIKQTSGAGTDYQIRIKVHYGSGTDSGEDVYLNGKCKSDFSDVRFTKDDGVTLLDYWIEEYVDGDYALFWVKLTDDLSAGDVTIYVYYGNEDATSLSDGESTFPFFDDFSGDLSKWVIESGSWSIQDGKLYCDAVGAEAIIRTDTFVMSNHAVRYKWQFINWREGSRDGVLARFQDTGNFYAYWLTQGVNVEGKSCSVEKRLNGSWEGYWIHYVLQDFTTNVWYKLSFRLYGNTVRAYFNDEEKLSVEYTDWASGKIGFRTFYNDIYIDWVLVRKYVYPEPEHGDWGSEETPYVPKTYKLRLPFTRLLMQPRGWLKKLEDSTVTGLRRPYIPYILQPMAKWEVEE
ncbi:MAG: hypothetical protein DRJ03_19060 [Chloroflexi bacterium]|nr:MAG: hypothetical protein DRJ03_19060 [Chloroflexota bacterium]